TVQQIAAHSLPDSGAQPTAPLLARPILRHTHPAGAFLVRLAFAVPEKLHLHAAVLIRVDLFARRSHHHRRLRAVHHRVRRHARRPERRVERNALETVFVSELFVFTATIAAALTGRVPDRRQYV